MLLRKGALRQMLDKMFVDKNRLEKPEIVVAAFEQIRLRSALPRVLAGRSPQSLIRIITFLKLHMFKNNYFHTLSEVADVLMSTFCNRFYPNTYRKILFSDLCRRDKSTTCCSTFSKFTTCNRNRTSFTKIYCKS